MGKFRATGCGYQHDAHSKVHHQGAAEGHRSDLIHDFPDNLYSEGKPLRALNPGYVKDGGHDQPHRAVHHPKPSYAGRHQYPQQQGGHGWAGEKREGHLRLSGQKGAHRIGKR